MMDSILIEKEALQLPDGDRALLADRLLQSLSRTPATLKKAWIKEADSRLKAYRAGKISVIAGPQAMAKLRSRFSG